MTARTGHAAVFMDCQMPDVDGYTAARVIGKREVHDGGRLPIIALTAHDLDGDHQKCLDAGIDEYVAKPIRVQAIKELIDRIPSLGAARARAARPGAARPAGRGADRDAGGDGRLRRRGDRVDRGARRRGDGTAPPAAQQDTVFEVGWR